MNHNYTTLQLEFEERVKEVEDQCKQKLFDSEHTQETKNEEITKIEWCYRSIEAPKYSKFRVLRRLREQGRVVDEEEEGT